MVETGGNRPAIEASDRLYGRWLACCHRSMSLIDAGHRHDKSLIKRQSLLKRVTSCIQLLSSTTMIINLSDPEISKTYQLVLKGESKDWLILAYSKVNSIPSHILF